MRSSASLRLSAVPIPSAPHFCRDRRGHYICRRRAAVGPARTARKKLVSDLISFPSFRRSQFSIFFCKSPSSERDPSGRAPGPARILSGCKDRLDRMRRRRLGTDSEGGEGARTGGATPEPFVALESEERSPQRGREREKERGRESRGGVPPPPLARGPERISIPSPSASRPRRSPIATFAVVVSSEPTRERLQGRVRGRKRGDTYPGRLGRSKRLSESEMRRVFRAKGRANDVPSGSSEVEPSLTFSLSSFHFRFSLPFLPSFTLLFQIQFRPFRPPPHRPFRTFH